MVPEAELKSCIQAETKPVIVMPVEPLLPKSESSINTLRESCGTNDQFEVTEQGLLHPELESRVEIAPVSRLFKFPLLVGIF